ncbi:hypothetical protein BKA59DRAFT_504525 [Fusarium tricinctum]|uniref:3'-5' exonuclease n=1 Tax=Fusarium tricinctum TaxID=61284 RepID=A0A8K0W6D6_9HYPO|nr:hypothetical protein BKA59DRAFT_504525 [Fusarium tricinctum]
MANCHSSHSIGDSAQENGLSTVEIRWTHQLKQLLQDLNTLPVKPPSIYLDASGFLVPPKKTLYVIDMGCLGATVLSTVSDNGKSLRLILESKAIPKIGFDIRGMSRLLFMQQNVSLGNMYDLQLMELASRDDRQSKKFLAGLRKCVKQDISDSNIVKRRVPRQSRRHVELFPALWTVYRRKLGVPSELVWLRFAHAESQERVQDSKKGPEIQGRRTLGPKSWWDHGQREAAIDDWNDELIMEIRVGHWKLNDDAEWVPTHKEKNGSIDQC